MYNNFKHISLPLITKIHLTKGILTGTHLYYYSNDVTVKCNVKLNILIRGECPIFCQPACKPTIRLGFTRYMVPEVLNSRD